MERLTEKVGEHFIARQERLNGKIVGNQTCLDKLGELEDAEEQGLLLRLPCKVGSRVYEIVDDCNFGTDCYTKMKCDGCEYRDLHIELLIMASESTIVLKMQDFGKTIFLTREEAEAALAEKGCV